MIETQHFNESLQNFIEFRKKLKICSDTDKITDSSELFTLLYFPLRKSSIWNFQSEKSLYIGSLHHYLIFQWTQAVVHEVSNWVLLMRRRNVTRSIGLLWAMVWRVSDMGFVFVGRGGRRAARTPSLSLYYLFSRRSCRLNGSWGVAYKPPTSACFAFHSSCQINRFLLWQIVSGW